MFKCEYCGEIFEEPVSAKEDRGEFWGAPCYETIYICPACGSDDFYELSKEEEEEVWG